MQRLNRAGSGHRSHKLSRRAKWLALAVSPLAAVFWADRSFGQTLTWDSSGANATSPVDGSGNWDTTTSANWSNGSSDVVWDNLSTAVIGSNGTAGTITIDDPSGAVTASGITINTTPGSDYTIAGGALNLIGSTPTITVASGQSPTISSVLSSSTGLTVAGTGTLNLTNNNPNLFGTIAVNGGTLVAGVGSLGSSGNALSVGTPNAGVGATQAGAVTLPTGTTTIGSFICASNISAANVVTIPTGGTLAVTSNQSGTGTNAVFALGSLAAITPVPLNTTTASLTMTGGGSLIVSGGTANSSFLADMGDTSNTTQLTNANAVATLNMAGLNSFTFTTGTLAALPTGNPPSPAGSEFDVGVGISTNVNVELATNNTITASVIDISDSNATPGSPNPLVVGQAGTTTGTLYLGSGTNTFNANSLYMSIGRGVGAMLWNTNTPTGSVTIAGVNGGLINIYIGIENGGTAGAVSGLSLTNATGSTGHSVNVNAGTIVLGNMVAAGTGKAGTQAGGSISFDTGMFNAQTLVFALANTSGNTSLDTSAGTFTVGTGPSSTGVLNVGSATSPGEVLLGDYTVAGGAGSGEKSQLIIKGGTANIFSNIIDASTAGSTGGTFGAFVTLTGGTLNMNGYDIGSTAAGTNGKRHVSLTFPTSSSGATLMNLGGTGINDAGLNVTSGSATGVLTLSGSNTYSGGTKITSGVLAIASDAAIPGGSASLTFNGGTLELKNYASGYSFSNVPNLSLGAATGASTPATLNGSIGGSSALTFVGPGTLILAGSNSFTGATTINAGNLAIGSDAELGYGAGGVTINGGNLQLNNYASTLSLTGANVGLAAANGAASSLGGAITGGTLSFNGPGQLNLLASNAYSGPTNLNKGILGIASDASVNYGAGGINFNGGTLQLLNTASTLALSGLNVNVGAAAGASSTLSGNVTDGTAGPTVLNYSGSGTLVAAGVNTYTGATNVTAGTLMVGSVASLPTNTNVTIGSVTTSGTVTTTTTGTLQLGHAIGAVTLGSLAVNAGSTLDVTNNPVIVSYSATDPVATIASYLADGYHGNWATGEITSSSVATANTTQSALIYSVGYADGADGVVANLSSGQIEILPTLAGDAKLAGNVVFGDFQLLAANFGLSAGWDGGNFSYSSVVNFGDFQLLAQNFGNSASNLTASEVASLGSFAAQFGDKLVPNSGGVGFSVIAVPEPASVGVLALAGFGVLRHRRRKI